MQELEACVQLCCEHPHSNLGLCGAACALIFESLVVMVGYTQKEVVPYVQSYFAFFDHFWIRFPTKIYRFGAFLQHFSIISASVFRLEAIDFGTFLDQFASFLDPSP